MSPQIKEMCSRSCCGRAGRIMHLPPDFHAASKGGFLGRKVATTLWVRSTTSPV
eukprot:CAMPEP_0206611784 /NCGR_PEP_ID=MMETSP0325_2-20121206/55530_1 /ASSEMBLY_ACC=CAM_ASM_000347 /TAXON_ID=2866 /ORGANISM="Crypthecodinium cohnii, Strain Seligo" /LENGTH=53 /DNA_ID=CAMNT_0054131211 /DNA_START=480 /DNA_END=641 /DNA_ORIENTATION=+